MSYPHAVPAINSHPLQRNNSRYFLTKTIFLRLPVASGLANPKAGTGVLFCTAGFVHSAVNRVACVKQNRNKTETNRGFICAVRVSNVRDRGLKRIKPETHRQPVFTLCGVCRCTGASYRRPRIYLLRRCLLTYLAAAGKNSRQKPRGVDCTYRRRLSLICLGLFVHPRPVAVR